MPRQAPVSHRMMTMFSANTLAIAIADQAGTLTLAERAVRFSAGTCVVIGDQFGTIEIADDMAAARRRVESVR